MKEDEGEKEQSTEGRAAEDSGVLVKEAVEGEKGPGLDGMLVTWIQEQRSGRHFDGPGVDRKSRTRQQYTTVVRAKRRGGYQ